MNRSLLRLATTSVLVPRGLFRGLAAAFLVAAACLHATAGEVNDSGWATADPRVPRAASPLGKGRIDAHRLVPPRVLRNLQLPYKAPSTAAPTKTKTGGLEWRPVRTARRPEVPVVPGTGKGDQSNKQPLGGAFRVPEIPSAQAAPETQALPEDAPREPRRAVKPPAKINGHEPAPFMAQEPKPLEGDAPLLAPPLQAVPEQQPKEQEPTQQEPREAAPPEETDKEPAEANPHSDAPRDNRDITPIEEPDEFDEPAEPAKKEAAPEKPSDPQAVVTDQGEGAAEEAASPAEGDAPKKTLPAAQPKNSRDFVTPKEVEKPQRKLPPLTRSQQSLRRRLRSVLSYYYRRPLNSVDHDAWEVMHSMLSYELYSRVQDGGRQGKPVTAVGYLCFNKPCKRYKMLYVTPEGNLDVRVGVGLQGHKGQLLAMLAQCNVSPDYPIKVDGKDFTIRDLVVAEQLTCYSRTELTFKLIGLMHYLPSDATWVNDQGEAWDFPKLIADERTQKIQGAACGGTHRLSGLALAAKKRVARGEPLEGEWLAARKKVEQHQKYALRLQNRDGSLSTEWFRGPGDEDDIDRRVRTTGHLLEWLIYSLPEEKLTDRRVFAAANYLTNLLMSNTDNGWEVGPISHALHALLLYDKKVFRPYEKAAASQVAGNSAKPSTPNYRSLNSRISESYYFVQSRHEAREEKRGLGGIFGFGNSRR